MRNDIKWKKIIFHLCVCLWIKWERNGIFMKINRSIQFIGRLITSILVLGITAFFTPGFTLENVWILAIAVIALTVLDFLIDNFTKLYFHPFVKLIIGFVLAGIALFLVQYFVIGYMLSFISIFLGALVYGLVDYMLPSEEDERMISESNVMIN